MAPFFEESAKNVPKPLLDLTAAFLHSAEKDGQTVTVHFQTPVVGSVTVEVAQAVNGLPHGPDGV